MSQKQHVLLTRYQELYKKYYKYQLIGLQTNHQEQKRIANTLLSHGHLNNYTYACELFFHNFTNLT